MVMNLTWEPGPIERVREMGRRIRESKSDTNWQDGVKKMEEALKEEGLGSAVMEVYSPSRVNGMAARLGIIPGLSMDLTTNDPDDGKP